ncbi:MAG: DNA/RNA nuclease SfsA [Eubacteriaceae bacterium]|jgi:sugar fermentation stimulation protein A|nr:DNA/RNA nuclease SfsA [Eubacteriaceae bacterium]
MTEPLYYSKGPLIEGTFVKRDNRFVARVQPKSGTEIHKAHVPNTGRMSELLVPGAKVALSVHDEAHRKTKYTLWAVLYKGIWVCIGARLANDIAEQVLSHTKDIETLTREVTYGSSRFDFSYSQKDRKVFCEVKSVNLVERGCALFPDAPTTRGVRHLKELTAAVGAGYGAQVLFVVQREDATHIRAHQKMDPAFDRALIEAAQAGVAISGIACRATSKSLEAMGTLPVIL